MTKEAQAGRNWGWLRYAGWGGAAVLVLLPAIAMRAVPDSGMNWSIGDFVFAAIFLGGVGLLLELTVRASSIWHRLAALVGAGTGFLLICANLAVGYVGNGESPINVVFLAIPLVALACGAAVRFRSAALAKVMVGAAAAHAIAGAAGYPQDGRTAPISIVFVILWLASAMLFSRAAREQHI